MSESVFEMNPWFEKYIKDIAAKDAKIEQLREAGEGMRQASIGMEAERNAAAEAMRAKCEEIARKVEGLVGSRLGKAAAEEIVPPSPPSREG